MVTQTSFRMLSQGGHVVGRMLYSIIVISWRSLQRIRIFGSEIGRTKLRSVQVQLEPLMSGARVFDLEAPFVILAVVCDLSVYVCEQNPYDKNATRISEDLRWDFVL